MRAQEKEKRKLWDIGEPRVEDKGHDQTVFSDEYFASRQGSPTFTSCSLTRFFKIWLRSCSIPTCFRPIKVGSLFCSLGSKDIKTFLLLEKLMLGEARTHKKGLFP